MVGRDPDVAPSSCRPDHVSHGTVAAAGYLDTAFAEVGADGAGFAGIRVGGGDLCVCDPGLRRRLISVARFCPDAWLVGGRVDRKSTRLNSSHLGISYAVFCFK